MSTLTHRIDRVSVALASSGVGHLFLRVLPGFVMIYHGSQKLFAWFGGYGVQGTAGFFESLGIPLPTLSVYLAGGAEFFGGIALILGLATRPFSAALTFTMLVAAFTAHSGFGAQNGGMEYPLVLAAVTAGLFFLGAGRLSLDHVSARVATTRRDTRVPLSAQPA